MGLNPEKMEELKQKYGIDDEAIFEIADSLEPDSEVPEFPNMGKTRTPAPSSPGALPASLASAMRGDISIAEAIILMDYMDRKDDRRERRYQPPQDTANIGKLLDELRDERRENREYLEKVVMRQRVEDSESRAKSAEQTLEEERAVQRQRDMVDGAVRGAVDQIGEVYGARLDEIARRISVLPENQQKGFWDEVFTDFEKDLKGQFKDLVFNRLKPPEKPVVTTDEEGKPSIDWGGVLDRGEKILDKFLDARREAPPRVPVQEVPIQPGGAPGHFPEGLPEAAEPVEPEPKEIVEEPIPKPVIKSSPIPPQDIDGIGPSRAKELEEMGITDARQLTQVSPGHLSDQLGISKEKAEDIVKQAKDLADQA